MTGPGPATSAGRAHGARERDREHVDGPVRPGAAAEGRAARPRHRIRAAAPPQRRDRAAAGRGLRWSGVEGAGNQILAAKIECEPERARLVRLWRPFTDAPGRRDVQARFAAWLEEEAKWAEGRLALAHPEREPAVAARRAGMSRA